MCAREHTHTPVKSLHSHKVNLPLGAVIFSISISRLERQMSECVQISWNLYTRIPISLHISRALMIAANKGSFKNSYMTWTFCCGILLSKLF